MFEGRYVFSQIIDFIPRDAMEAYIKKYHGNKKIRKVTCRDQFLALMFGQLTGLRSLTVVKYSLKGLPRSNLSQTWVNFLCRLSQFIVFLY